MLRIDNVKADRKFFSVLMNGNDDKEANVNMIGFSEVHQSVCREKLDIIVNELKNAQILYTFLTPSTNFPYQLINSIISFLKI